MLADGLATERHEGTLRRLYTRLELRINEAKSAIAIATSRKLLGYSFWDAPGRTVKCRIAKNALETMNERVRLITRRTVGRSIERVVGDVVRSVTFPGRIDQSDSSGREEATRTGRTTVVAVTTSGSARDDARRSSRTVVRAEVSAFNAWE